MPCRCSPHAAFTVTNAHPLMPPNFHWCTKEAAFFSTCVGWNLWKTIHFQVLSGRTNTFIFWFTCATTCDNVCLFPDAFNVNYGWTGMASHPLGNLHFSAWNKMKCGSKAGLCSVCIALTHRIPSFSLSKCHVFPKFWEQGATHFWLAVAVLECCLSNVIGFLCIFSTQELPTWFFSEICCLHNSVRSSSPTTLMVHVFVNCFCDFWRPSWEDSQIKWIVTKIGTFLANLSLPVLSADLTSETLCTFWLASLAIHMRNTLMLQKTFANTHLRPNCGLSCCITPFL